MDSELARYTNLLRQYMAVIDVDISFRDPLTGNSQSDEEEDEAMLRSRVEKLEGTSIEENIRADTGHFLYKNKSPMDILAEWTSQMAHRYIPDQPQLWAAYRNRIFCGKYSKQGDMFMSASQDRMIRIYDTVTSEKVKVIQARNIGWSIIDTDYSPDKRWLIYSSWSPYIHLCNIQGEIDTHEALDCYPETDRFCLFSVKFSPDSREILGGSSDQHMYIYNLERREVEHKVLAHSNDINTVTYMEETNGNIIITGSDDQKCKVWDRRQLSENATPQAVMRGHFRGITHVSSKGDGRYFLSNGKDQTLRLWDLRNPAENVSTYSGHTVASTLIRAYFSPAHTTGQKYIYSGSHNGCIYVWDVLTGAVVKKIVAHSATIRDVSWHPYEATIMSTSWDTTVKKWTHKERTARVSSSE
ncbi:hypothetical protein PROFUN_04923 [Planoprotostelium fungivorum]|uniref:Uncharacterized protein n=1 Tax=Planoprotostelium fungivorum TaxID=1890364 RepID=A0A2P6NFA9_9EUKA|nr:hypothetical protein PROFUN_04923 [Planoprotostelium fungivorum]